MSVADDARFVDRVCGYLAENNALLRVLIGLLGVQAATGTAGIPSGERFGVGGVVVQGPAPRTLQGLAGIPTGEAFSRQGKVTRVTRK